MICMGCMSTDVGQGTHLDDSGKVTQVESVVGLGRRGQQLGNGLAVHLQSSSNDAWAQLLAALGEPSTAEVPCQNGLEDCHQCLVCHLGSNNITSASNSMRYLCMAFAGNGRLAQTDNSAGQSPEPQPSHTSDTCQPYICPALWI